MKAQGVRPWLAGSEFGVRGASDESPLRSAALTGVRGDLSIGFDGLLASFDEARRFLNPAPASLGLRLPSPQLGARQPRQTLVASALRRGRARLAEAGARASPEEARMLALLVTVAKLQEEVRTESGREAAFWGRV